MSADDETVADKSGEGVGDPGGDQDLNATVADAFEEAVDGKSGDQDIDAEVRHPGTAGEAKDAGEKVRDKADRLRDNIEVD